MVHRGAQVIINDAERDFVVGEPLRCFFRGRTGFDVSIGGDVGARWVAQQREVSLAVLYGLVLGWNGVVVIYVVVMYHEWG